MASYAGTAHFYLNGNLSLAELQTGEVISDDGGDLVFTVGEAVSDNSGTFANGAGTFVGTININGTDYPIFSENDSGGAINESVVFVVTPAGFDAADLPANLSGAVASNLIVCFLTGTRIATPQGETAVEDLNIGDLVQTADGKTVPVRWVGWQKVVCAFYPPARLTPVRVRAGALGNALPHRDLVLTADHALCIDGLLINAGALVNGTSIAYVPLSDLGRSYTVYHVETEGHELILAEGTAAETYIDDVGRQQFHNYGEYLALYGDEAIITELPMPRISSARLVPQALRDRLAGQHAAA